MQNFSVLKRGIALWPMSNCLGLLNVSFCPCLHVEWNTAIQPQNAPKANIPNLAAGKARWQNRLKPFTERQNNTSPWGKTTQGYFLTSWEETIASDRKQRLAARNGGAGALLGGRKKIGVGSDVHAVNTMKPAHIANHVHEPHELQCTYSAKSSLAKRYRNKAREVKANRDNVTRAGRSSSRHFSEGKVRSGGDLCSLKRRPTVFVTVHIFLILDHVTVALCLFR